MGKSRTFDDLCVSKKNKYYLKLSNPTVVQPFDKPIQYSPQSDERKKTWDLISWGNKNEAFFCFFHKTTGFNFTKCTRKSYVWSLFLTTCQIIHALDLPSKNGNLTVVVGHDGILGFKNED